MGTEAHRADPARESGNEEFQAATEMIDAAISNATLLSYIMAAESFASMSTEAVFEEGESYASRRIFSPRRSDSPPSPE